MPTYETTTRFTADLGRLTPEQRRLFRRTVARAFVPDLGIGRIRASLRIKRVQRAPAGVFELTWAGSGRATWQYGPEIVPGSPHIVWRRIGTHDILAGP